MIKKHRIILARLLFLGDLLLVFTAWIISYGLRFYWEVVPAPKGAYSFSYHMSLAIVILTLWGISLQLSGLYKFKRLISRAKSIVKIFHASLFATLIFIAATYLFQEYRFSRGVLSYFFVAIVFLLSAFRFWVRELLAYLRSHGYNLRHILIVGTGPLAQKTAEKIRTHSEVGIHIIGFVSPHTDQNSPKVVGSISDLPKLLAELGIDQVILALDAKDYEKISAVLNLLKSETVDVKIVPEFYRFASLHYDIEELDGLPFITLNDTPLEGWNFMLKRLIDITLGSFFLIITLPVIAVVSLLIKVCSPGPIFYKQERVGLDGKPFWIFKFRTMEVDAEQKTGAVWATAQDQRKTKLGTFLRKTSLDEIPQFLNVIRGEMSLVGPRPERPVFVKQFKDHYPNYMLRHKVKAGLTGWAQVNGWRGNTDLERRIEHDLYYIKNWTAYLDLKIMWLTVWRGFFNKNAY